MDLSTCGLLAAVGVGQWAAAFVKVFFSDLICISHSLKNKIRHRDALSHGTFSITSIDSDVGQQGKNGSSPPPGLQVLTMVHCFACFAGKAN